MTKPRKRRSDSAATAVQAAQNAALGPRMPLAHANITLEAKPFWLAIMRNRPRDRWNDADLALAAVLARTEQTIMRLMDELDDEGDADGVNPKHALIDKLVTRAVRLSKLLHVHPEATEGRAREAGKTLAVERAAEADNDPLIPTLRAVR